MGAGTTRSVRSTQRSEAQRSEAKRSSKRSKKRSKAAAPKALAHDQPAARAALCRLPLPATSPPSRQAPAEHEAVALAVLAGDWLHHDGQQLLQVLWQGGRGRWLWCLVCKGSVQAGVASRRRALHGTLHGGGCCGALFASLSEVRHGHATGSNPQHAGWAGWLGCSVASALRSTAGLPPPATCAGRQYFITCERT